MPPDAGRSIASEVLVEIQCDDDGHRRLVTTTPVASGDPIFTLEGIVRSAPTRFSIQVGMDRHLDDMGPGDATNHSCDPSAYVDLSDPDHVVLRALRDLAAGDEVSIHYCATEYDMEVPFDCACGAAACLGRIRGFRHLPADRREALRPRLSPSDRAP